MNPVQDAKDRLSSLCGGIDLYFDIGARSKDIRFNVDDLFATDMVL